MHRIQLRHLDQQRRQRRSATRYQLQIAHRCKECRTFARTIVPAFALLEAQRLEQFPKLREGFLRGDQRHACKSLDHASIVSLARPNACIGDIHGLSYCSFFRVSTRTLPGGRVPISRAEVRLIGCSRVTMRAVAGSSPRQA